MRLHIIEGAAGCRFAVKNKAAAVVVDALRASATAAALLARNATRLYVTATVNDARVLKQEMPDALLYGERGGLPPTGFDYGNSPEDAVHASGKPVIFTTTTGAGRLVDAWGATPLLMATTVNARSVVRYLLEGQAEETVLIPAGLMDEPGFDAQEDWAAAAYIAQELAGNVLVQWGKGYEAFTTYSRRLVSEGLEALFMTAPHAEKLRAIGKGDDIVRCAATNIIDALPVAIEKTTQYVMVMDAMRLRAYAGST